MLSQAQAVAHEAAPLHCCARLAAHGTVQSEHVRKSVIGAVFSFV
jgi:hypothetical protein